MLVIKDAWGNIVFEDEDYDKVVAFGRRYMEKLELPFIKVHKKTGIFHSVIEKE